MQLEGRTVLVTGGAGFIGSHLVDALLAAKPREVRVLDDFSTGNAHNLEQTTGRKDVRIITVMAVAALPLVWMFQYSGGAGPQWGGRYTLLSGALLLVAATVVLEGHRAALVATVMLAALVTGFGLTWLSVRSTWAAHAIERIVDRHDQAVISGEAHVLREGGAFYDTSRHWLTTTSDTELHQAVAIVDQAGDTEFAYVVSDGVKLPRAIDGYQRAGVERVQFLRPDLYLQVATYRQS